MHNAWLGIWLDLAQYSLVFSFSGFAFSEKVSKCNVIDKLNSRSLHWVHGIKIGIEFYQ